MVHRGYSKYLRYFLFWIDILILNIVNILIGYFHYHSFSFVNNPLWLKYLIFYNVIWGIISSINPPNNIFANRKLSLFSLLQSVIINIIVHGSIILGFIVFINLNDYEYYFHIYTSFTITIIFTRLIILSSLIWYRKKGYNYRNVILIEVDSSKTFLKNYLEKHTELGYRLKKVFNNITPERINTNQSELKNYISKNEIDEVIINPINIPVNILNELINFIEDQFIKVRILSDLGLSLNRKLKSDHFGQFWFLDISPLPLDELKNRMVKRTFDIIFSLIVILLILSWVLPIIWILIYFETGIPIIFKQIRSGEKNKLFWCYKFRTMTMNNEADSIQATENDIRITKIGRFLRKTSIDELPQFLNVLKGEMSVVGPRPHMVKHTEDYSKIIDRYFQRHYVKPGITGLAQTSGFRGEINHFQDIKGRVDLDKLYIENWSIWEDFKIVFNTVKQIFIPIKKVF